MDNQFHFPLTDIIVLNGGGGFLIENCMLYGLCVECFQNETRLRELMSRSEFETVTIVLVEWRALISNMAVNVETFLNRRTVRF
jgi:hypothetical protein